MPLGQGIAEILEAIPARIEVSGQGPTWRITGPSFDTVLEYAEECYDQPIVLSCHRRDRLWPRVTLTVTTDPELATSAPPLDVLRTQGERSTRRRAGRTDNVTPLCLDEIFADQEARRAERLGRIPPQREG